MLAPAPESRQPDMHTSLIITAPAPTVSVAPVAVAASSVDLIALTQTLMEVVSEKTGYPVWKRLNPPWTWNPISY